MKRWLLLAAATLAFTFAPGDGVRARPGGAADAARIGEMITGLDFDDARRAIAAADDEDPRIAYEKARLAVYEADCDGAVTILARPDVARTEAGAQLADIARGCARVTAATLVDRDERRAIEIRWQDEHDRALAPLIYDTVSAARDALTRDLGVTWPKPTRITVVRDLMSLSAMTGLPQEAAMTTGTVAVAKWGRVTLLSPRASHHGYAWRDTIAHELTHLAVSRATIDHAPLWLQEGMAKREEVRWRAPGPFDDRPTPESIVQKGMEKKLDLPLDKLGPSIAMLPSADAAMVAFAEVTSFVRFYADTASGDAGAADGGASDALPRLLAALRAKDDPDAALKEASGADLKAWDTRWRAWLASKPKEPLPAIFGLGAPAPGTREKERDLRERVRLAELLVGRAHAHQAIAELDRITLPGAAADASLRHLRARAMEAAAHEDGAPPDGGKIEAVLGEPKDVVSSYGPWWAIRGRFARVRGDGQAADAFFVEAVAADPFDVEGACQSLDPAFFPASPSDRALCEAARASGEPPIGQD